MQLSKVSGVILSALLFCTIEAYTTPADYTNDDSNYEVTTDSVIDYCDSMNICQNNGTCSYYTHYYYGICYQCDCPYGYTGKYCGYSYESLVNPVVNLRYNHRESLAISNSFPPIPRDYRHNPCSFNPCLNGATCYSYRNGCYKCHCPYGYEGYNCEKPFHDVTTSDTNTTPDSNYEVTTDSVIDYCDSMNICQNNGTCSYYTHYYYGICYQCDCPYGYTGKYCGYSYGFNNYQTTSSGLTENIVQVSCENGYFDIEVDMELFRQHHPNVSSIYMYFGYCRVYSYNDYFSFGHYNLRSCGSTRKETWDKIIYSNTIYVMDDSVITRDGGSYLVQCKMEREAYGEGQCSVDSTTVIYNTTFGFKTFEFIKEKGEIDIVCRVFICTEDDNSYRCTRRCSGYRKRRSTDNDDKPISIYEGPFVFAADDEADTTTAIAVGTTAGVVAVVAFVAVTIKVVAPKVAVAAAGYSSVANAAPAVATV
ncbi:hypothetical protein LOTGIDRAFT_229585 [Lottia gigantea]|uniref:EGF-like domain-containing protein n=1 Tax=Lottia gigantea TaxID=225164 RepID=V3ZNM0_LOTGI|nr:hypothetical protein LOTGIDRAFT_229585 [Lottia gigantea]ESO84075.1 hypothetical protein LOTGIDRAFT_229585 [Lottia gigantea]